MASRPERLGYQAFQCSPSSIRLPIKQLSFDLASRSLLDLVQQLQQAESETTASYQALLNATGLEKQPLLGLSTVIAVCGSIPLATGLATALTYPHANSYSSQPPQKIALLEWGNPHSQMKALFPYNPQQAGLIDLFEGRCDLSHLILNAKLYRPAPQLYVISQGMKSQSPTAYLNEFSRLMMALSKKFHRIVLSFPSLEESPPLIEALSRLNLGYALFFDPDEWVLLEQERFKTFWPNSVIQRVIPSQPAI